MKKIATGYYKEYYYFTDKKGNRSCILIEVIKVEGSDNWYWKLYKNSISGGEDWYSTKKIARLAAISYIQQNF